jgi:hypothetical protein
MRMRCSAARMRGRDARIEEARQLARSAAFRQRADQEPPCAGDRQGQDYSDGQDCDYLLDLGADKDPDRR